MLRIYQHMCEFYCDADMHVLAEHKSKIYYWLTCKPYVQLLYIPNTPSAVHYYGAKETKNYSWSISRENEYSRNCRGILSELQFMAIKTAIYSLLLDFSDWRSSLLILKDMEGGLIPFIIASPIYVPRNLLKEAQMVVQCLKKYMILQPLSLVDLAKAALAKIYCGLYAVLNSEDYIYFLKHHYHMQQKQRDRH